MSEVIQGCSFCAQLGSSMQYIPGPTYCKWQISPFVAQIATHLFIVEHLGWFPILATLQSFVTSMGHRCLLATLILFPFTLYDGRASGSPTVLISVFWGPLHSLIFTSTMPTGSGFSWPHQHYRDFLITDMWPGWSDIFLSCWFRFSNDQCCGTFFPRYSLAICMTQWSSFNWPAVLAIITTLLAWWPCHLF